jgi:hypothetical protein
MELHMFNREELLRMAGVTLAHRWLIEQILLNMVGRLGTPEAQDEALAKMFKSGGDIHFTNTPQDASAAEQAEVQIKHARDEIRSLVKNLAEEIGRPVPT